jgi:hypothetical protein
VRRRLGLFLVLAGTYLAARALVAQVVGGRSPELRPYALHAAAVPLAQLALLEAVERAFAGRRKAA